MSRCDPCLSFLRTAASGAQTMVKGAQMAKALGSDKPCSRGFGSTAGLLGVLLKWGGCNLLNEST